MEGYSDTQQRDIAMTQLRKIYGNSIPNPTSVVVTRWNREPYAHGSYSYNAVGATQQMRCVGQCDPPPY
jgi:monoamine oxidase